jgi:hypothetical protein
MRHRRLNKRIVTFFEGFSLVDGLTNLDSPIVSHDDGKAFFPGN